MVLASAAQFGIDLSDAVTNPVAEVLESLIPLIAIIFVFGMPVLIVMAVLRFRARRQQSVHDMVLKLADKGQPIPPELFLEPGRKPRSAVATGLSLVGAGIGLMGFFWFADAEEAMGLGFIPLMIGLGQLLAWKIEQDRKPE